MNDHPLWAELERDGATWGEARAVGAWTTALDFGDPERELDALLTGAALVDASARGTLVVSGEDRAAWLHGLCTQEVKKLRPGEGARACHIDVRGRVIADLGVSALDDLLVLDVEPGVAPNLKRVFRRYVVMEDVKVTDRSEQTGSLELLGPGWAAALAWVGLGDELAALLHLSPHAVAPLELRGVECMAVGTRRLGVPGVRLSCPREALGRVWRALRANPAVAPCGWRAQETARVLLGQPRQGAELSEEVLFNELGLDEAVSFNKGCYLGQEVIERVEARNRAGRRLMGLQVEGEAPPAGSELMLDGKKVGVLTSAAAYQGQAWGMGFVAHAKAEEDARVEVAGRPARLLERRNLSRETLGWGI
jgi:folate-binding protein YgfZ